MDNPQYGPGQEGRVGVQGYRKKKRRGEEEAEDDKGDEELDQLEMMVPQLTGDAKVIKLLKFSEAVKNLGLFA